MSEPVRAPWDQPFASTSPWNIGIGSGAQWASSSDPAVQTLHSLAAYLNTADWGLPIFVGGSSDPLVTLTTADGEIPSQQVHVPADAQPPGGSDRNMSFFDMSNPGTLYTYWNAQFNNGYNATGGITFGLGDAFPTTGDGFSNTLYSSQVGYNYAGGVITPYDLQTGTIAHMLRLAISANDLMMPAGATWNSNDPYPMNHTDYNGPSQYTGNIPADSTFGIPANVDLNSLGLSQGGMMLAKALQDYGAIEGDIAGNNELVVYSEAQTASNPLMGEMQGDLQKLLPYISIMSNQSASSENGGGSYPYEVTTPLAAPGLTTANNYAPPMNAGQAASPDSTVITQPGQTITDSSGNAWSIYNGEVNLNNVLDSSTSNVVAMAYEGGTIWQEQSGGNWSSLVNLASGWSSPTTTSPVSGSGVTPSGSSSSNGSSGGSSTNTPPSGTQTPVITLSGSSSSITESNSTVTGTGNFTLDLQGSGDSVKLSGGNQQITVEGANNTIDAGAGNNSITDTGNHNTLVLPAAGAGYDDIFGNFLQNGDILDFRPMLAGTGFTGDASTLGQFLQVSTSANGQDAIIAVNQTAGGTATPVATLHGAGGLSLSTLQANALV